MCGRATWITAAREIGSKLQTLDLDHDGFIKVSELSDTVRDILGPSATDKEVWRVVRQLDEDGDGIGAFDANTPRI